MACSATCAGRGWRDPFRVLRCDDGFIAWRVGPLAVLLDRRKKARARRADALGLVAGGAARNVSENLLFKPFSTSGRNLLGAFEVHANAPRALGKRAIGISF